MSNNRKNDILSVLKWLPEWKLSESLILLIENSSEEDSIKLIDATINLLKWVIGNIKDKSKIGQFNDAILELEEMLEQEKKERVIEIQEAEDLIENLDY